MQAEKALTLTSNIKQWVSGYAPNKIKMQASFSGFPNTINSQAAFSSYLTRLLYIGWTSLFSASTTSVAPLPKKNALFQDKRDNLIQVMNFSLSQNTGQCYVLLYSRYLLSLSLSIHILATPRGRGGAEALRAMTSDISKILPGYFTHTTAPIRYLRLVLDTQS